MSLAQTLTEEAHLVGEFVGLLANEQKMLSKGDIHELQLSTDAKNNLIEKLTQLAATRDKLLRANGFPENSEGLQMWMALNAEEALKEVYERLRKLSIEARRLNDLNSHLVSMRLQVTQQALSVLLPQEQSPALYDTLGQSSHRVGYKLIDSA